MKRCCILNCRVTSNHFFLGNLCEVSHAFLETSGKMSWTVFFTENLKSNDENFKTYTQSTPCTMEIQFYLAAVDICPYHFWDIIPPAGWLVLDRTQLFVNQSDKGPGTNCLILFPRTVPTLPTLTLMAAESPYFVCGELFYGSGIRKFPIQFLEKRKKLYFTFFPKSFLQT